MLAILDNPLAFTTPDFQGSLSLLFQLVKKEQVDIVEICLTHFTHQLMDKLQQINALEEGAENMLLLAHLLRLKSSKLLPTKKIELDESVGGQVWEEFAHLIVFREMASELGALEKDEHFFFARSVQKDVANNSPMAIQEVEIEDLVSLFQKILKKQPPPLYQVVLEEEWQVGSKIDTLRALLNKGPLLFTELFSHKEGKVTLILLFLALLELIKLGEIFLQREGEDIIIGRKHG